jgi:MATE family multidrug resistance protein
MNDTLPEVTPREVLKLAVPAMVFAVLTHGYRIVDQYWSQGISTEAQAAIGSSFFILILMYACYEVIAAGAGPLVARATGAGDAEERRTIIGNALTATGAITLLVMLVGGLGAEWLAASVGLYGETAAEFSRYVRWLSLTILPLALTPLVDHCFISMGDTKTPMTLQAGSLALNMILTPLFIYPLGLGIVGAALASNASRAVSTGLGLWILLRRVELRREHLLGTSQTLRISRVGLPMALSTASYAGVWVLLLYFAISPLGPEINAALGIGFSALESISWPAFHGIALALASIVGRAMGAGRTEDAWKGIRLTLPWISALGLAVALTFGLAGGWLTSWFTSDPVVHMAASEYAYILAFSQIFVAYECLAEGVLAGAGDTRRVFWLSTPINILRVPLGWYAAFPLGMGAAGVWWAINLTTLVKALLKGWAVWRGRWAELDI